MPRFRIARPAKVPWRGLARAWRRHRTKHPWIGWMLVLALAGGAGLLATLPAGHEVRRTEPGRVQPATAQAVPGPARGNDPVPPPRPPAQAADSLKPAQEAALHLPPALPPSAAARPAWLRFAVPAPASGNRPLVAVVLDDLGLDRMRTAAAIRLAGPVTLSFMTYAGDLAEQTAAARRMGHELLVHVPMEAVDPRQNPGPHALYTTLSRAEIVERLRWGLGRFDGYVGVNNHMGSKFTADPRAMAPVIEELRSRGLIFLDSRTTAASSGVRLAAADGVPHAARNVFLDDDPAAPAIARQLALVEAAARRHGSAIAIGHAHDQTLAALLVWLPSLGRKGLALVPVSAIVRRRMAEEGEAAR